MVSLRTQADFGGIFKSIQLYERYDGANKMQINTELFLKLFHIKSKEIGSQSDGSIGRPLGFVTDRLNTSASLHRIAPCLSSLMSQPQRVLKLSSA